MEQRKAAFIEANQKKTAARDFFPIVTKEFREKWPMSPVTQQEVDDAGTIELATRVKQGKYDKVTHISIREKEKLTYINSESLVGSPTTPGPSRLAALASSKLNRRHSQKCSSRGRLTMR